MLEAHAPGGRTIPAGVVLRDLASARFYSCIRQEWDGDYWPDDPDNSVILTEFAREFREQLDNGVSDMLHQLLDEASLTVRIQDCGIIETDSPEQEISQRASDLGIA
ncbi:MAG: hypothetical protein JNK87_25745 [Bryobacterales bacterium]|nr:hypothetical protein [Bryobacterales bacterium]